mgnify:CR=1 FL=1
MVSDWCFTSSMTVDKITTFLILLSSKISTYNKESIVSSKWWRLFSGALRLIRNFPWLLILKIYNRIFVCWEKMNEDILSKKVCKSFIWVTNLGTIHGEVLPNCCCLPRQTIKVNAFSQWWLAFKQQNTNSTKTNQKTHVDQLISDKFCS